MGLKIVVTGPTCSGKTTIAWLIAAGLSRMCGVEHVKIEDDTRPDTLMEWTAQEIGQRVIAMGNRGASWGPHSLPRIEMEYTDRPDIVVTTKNLNRTPTNG